MRAAGFIGKGLLSALGRRWVLLSACTLALSLALFGIWLTLPFWRLSRQFASFTAARPSHIYAQPLTLEAGQSVGSVDRLASKLLASGFVEVEDRPAVGTFRRHGQQLDLVTPEVLTELGWQPPKALAISISGSKISQLRTSSKSAQSVAVASPVVAVFVGDDGAERLPVRIGDLPDHVTRAVLAAEDTRFYEHSGISPKGIARAAVSNVRGGGPLQGGSTLTQQLVKNLYLTHERTWTRKLREAVLALIIDARYSKNQILEAYLNEIYWGRSGDVNIAGIGAAASAYFNKSAQELSVSEAALLAGMISAPANYLPTVHPDRAVDRRNWVLRRMEELQWLSPELATRAQAESLHVRTTPLIGRRAAFFVDRVVREASDRFALVDLKTAGFDILSTLDLGAQQAAESAVAKLQKPSEEQAPPEVAMVSVDAETGAIRAYLGGTRYGRSQFDRVRQMRRQAGSAFKPVVYTAALAAGRITPASLLVDEPLTVQIASQTWSPENSNGEYRGWVTARRAIEDSLNIPTARLGLDIGLKQVVEVARKMGIEAPLKPYPSLSLGAFEVSPQELVTVYATLASEGVRPTVHAVVSVRDRRGELVEGEPLASRERVISPQVAYLMTSLLRGVMDRGTGRFARSWGLSDGLAGKTGTSNERRDSWFAGYSPDIATAVWVGYDDNAATSLGGARAALPIWTEYMKATRPAGGYPEFRRPEGVESAWIDPLTGFLAAPECPTAVSEDFLKSDVPGIFCPMHRGRFRYVFGQIDPRQLPPGVEIVGRQRGEEPEQTVRKKKRGFLRRVFGRRNRRSDG